MLRRTPARIDQAAPRLAEQDVLAVLQDVANDAGVAPSEDHLATAPDVTEDLIQAANPGLMRNLATGPSDEHAPERYEQCRGSHTANVARTMARRSAASRCCQWRAVRRQSARVRA